MFFSKFLLPSFALLSLATTALSTPVAQVDAQVEKRQLGDVLGPLQSLQSTIAPILSGMTSTASAGGNIAGLVGQLTSAFSGTTSTLSGLTGQQTNGADPTAAVTSIVSSVLGTVGNLPPLSNAMGSPMDSSLSNFLNVMNVLSPGILSSVGSAMPQALTGLPLSGLLNILNLNSVVSLLNLTGLLTGLLGGLLGGLGGL